MQEMLERGLISVGTHNVSYAHSDADVAKLLAAYDEIFPMLRDAVENRAIHQYLRCKPLVPLFRLR
jgi:glutamate-1-semialdehyde 2,1-aminomutase